MRLGRTTTVAAWMAVAAAQFVAPATAQTPAAQTPASPVQGAASPPAAGPSTAAASRPAATSAARDAARAAYVAALKNPFDDAAFKAYLATLRKARHPLLKDRVLYLVEGDMLSSEDEVRAALVSRAAVPEAKAQQKPELIVAADANGPAYWAAPAARALKYAVARTTFPDQGKYDQVVTDMRLGAGDWVSLCEDCGLTFEHVQSLDTLDAAAAYLPQIQSGRITFVVQYAPGDADTEGTIAYAFFPNQPVASRTLVVLPAYFELAGSIFSPRGVMRHELGHILGYRHEHTRDGIQGCSFEDKEWRPLTSYDGNSVMHYPCGPSSARGDLALTETDREGHVKLYGPGSSFAATSAATSLKLPKGAKVKP